MKKSSAKINYLEVSVWYLYIDSENYTPNNTWSNVEWKKIR